MLGGYRVTQTLYVAAKLGIADLLRDGAMSSDELAKTTRTHPAALRRLMRALASLGVLEEDARGRFGLTPVGACLRSDAAGSLRAGALFLGGEESWRAWGALLHSVTTGTPAFEHVFGKGVFDRHAEHPEQGKIFDEAMVAFTAQVADAVVRAYDFSKFDTVVDVGGGTGAFLAAILRAYARPRGILFDTPSVVARAPGVLAAAGIADRCAIVGGSFFESIPEGGDAYIFKRIIHDWGDEQAAAILATCRRSMKKGARLLVVDEVLPRRAEPFQATAAFLLDLEMLVHAPGGHERTEPEFRTLFAAAGFRLTRIVQTAAERLGVVEGLPA
jgi:hypothetical protein